jgi:hypothetical protein
VWGTDVEECRVPLLTYWYLVCILSHALQVFDSFEIAATVGTDTVPFLLASMDGVLVVQSDKVQIFPLTTGTRAPPLSE